MSDRLSCHLGGGGGGCNSKNRRLNKKIANLGVFGFVVLPILTGVFVLGFLYTYLAYL